MTENDRGAQERLAALRVLSEAATPGPWRTGHQSGARDGVWSESAVTGHADDEDSSLVAWCHSDYADEADAAFIAAAANYVRDLIAAGVSVPAEPGAGDLDIERWTDVILAGTGWHPAARAEAMTWAKIVVRGLAATPQDPATPETPR